MRVCCGTRMMYILPALCLLLELSLCHSAAVSNDPNTFYEFITKECSFDLKKAEEFTKIFRNEDVFKHCVDWEKISQTTTLTKENENNVLCLLYFESFVSFCKVLPKVNVTKVTIIDLVPEPKVLNYTVDVICKNLSLIPAGTKYSNVSKIVNRDSLCIKLCSDYTGEPVRECSLAYYYTNYIASQLKGKAVANQGAEAPKPVVGKDRPIFKANQQTGSEKVINPDLPAKREPPVAAQSKARGVFQVQTNNAHNTSSLAQNVKHGNSEGPKQSENKVKTVGSSKVQTTPTTTTTHLPTEEKHEDIKKPKTNAQEIQNGPNAAQGGTGNVKKTPSDPAQVKTQESPAKANQDPESSANMNGLESPPKANQPIGVDNTLHQRNEEPGKQNENEESERESLNRKYIDDNEPDDDTNNEDNAPPPEVPEQISKVPEQSSKTPSQAKTSSQTKKPSTQAEQMTPVNNTADGDGESYFLSYFMVVCVLFIVGYVGYRNRQKVMALMVEGKRGKRQYRSRRPNSANYHKLDSNLEEAISSSCTRNTSHVIY